MELAAFLREHGIEARRGQQFSGGADSPDVVTSLPGVHIEAKRCETFRLWDALDQANRDKHADQLGVVFHRKNKRPWVVVLGAEDFLRLLNRQST